MQQSRPSDKKAYHAARGDFSASRDEMGRSSAYGLYDPASEHDACGLGFVARLDGKASHSILDKAMDVLKNLEHRGATGYEKNAGDGAGVMTHIPHKLFAASAHECGVRLPEIGAYGVLQMFVPREDTAIEKIKALASDVTRERGHSILFWRQPASDPTMLSTSVRAVEPRHLQMVIALSSDFRSASADGDAGERELYIVRRMITNRVLDLDIDQSLFYVVSSSTRCVIYKGMFLSAQLPAYYSDLVNPDYETGFALVHQRFSTNTMPSWRLAHPYRFLAHNGEINTVRGNVNWMRARESSLKSDIYGDDLKHLHPLSRNNQSDSACLDNAVEYLRWGGYGLAKAMVVLVPPAWENDRSIEGDLRGFYDFHSTVMEPWDGPIACAFSDGLQIGARLDRNGLRPARYCVTNDDLVIFASEAGVLPVHDSDIRLKGRLVPGKSLLVDFASKQLICDDQMVSKFASEADYRSAMASSTIDLPPSAINVASQTSAKTTAPDAHERIVALGRYGYTREEFKQVIAPMAGGAAEAIGAMGNDLPLAILSGQPRLLYDYFRQKFSQVTNPATDPIREEIVINIACYLGERSNLFYDPSDLPSHSSPALVKLESPILTPLQLQSIEALGAAGSKGKLKVTRVITAFVDGDAQTGLEQALAELREDSIAAVRAGADILILTDRGLGDGEIAIPALLATSTVHHHLVAAGVRTECSLVIETAEARQVHHFCSLIGYGAEAVSPWLALESLPLVAQFAPTQFSEADQDIDALTASYLTAINKGIKKVMSKIGIATIQSYCGAQIFDALGVSKLTIDEYFPGTATQLGGLDVSDIEVETKERWLRAGVGDRKASMQSGDTTQLPDDIVHLPIGGSHQLRTRAESRAWNFESIASLQHAVRGDSNERYRDFAQTLNARRDNPLSIRDLLAIHDSKSMNASSIPLSQVESAAEIVKRFSTGGMSFGALSIEAHETLAIAMNRIGAKSNTGEGGELPERSEARDNGDHAGSAIRQVASGRFGVNVEYLRSARVIQIKIAQGAKPGEGGQLPGKKVDSTIAKVRMSTPGVGLISPPPHHDIYSIEDLAQLIFDLKNVNPHARISVKLVSISGVGTVAAGVAKARADHITIAGHDGGTGASPISSIYHAGSPWELGLAEAQQTLVQNGLRGRVVLETDGGLRTGRDVMVAALLGADEFGFATAPLIALGCVMMRKCHLNTCPVGVASQDPVLRARFRGQPEHVVNYFFFVAQEIRELLASMGARSIEEIIGRVEWLYQTQHEIEDELRARKVSKIDLSAILTQPRANFATPEGSAIKNYTGQRHPIDHVLDKKLIATFAQGVISEQSSPPKSSGESSSTTPITESFSINNADRSVGAMLSGELFARRKSGEWDSSKGINYSFSGSAGQSFGAFLENGIEFTLIGEANDYFGKGLSGGRLALRTGDNIGFDRKISIIAGNTALYGATAGEAYIAGRVGERFAVRNSGAIAIVEGVGDHGCEYMTGGQVVVLGPVGRNFAAGMSGGIAYVYDPEAQLRHTYNPELVDLVRLQNGQADGAMAQDVSLTEAVMSDYDFDSYSVDVNLLANDEMRLRCLLARHYFSTGSNRAKTLLSNWSRSYGKFIKIVPREYAAALAQYQETIAPARQEPAAYLKQAL